MSTLDSSSTLAEINAAYDDNGSYEEDASTAKAAAFITACKLLLRRRPKVAAIARDGPSVEHDPKVLQELLDSARAWLASTPSTAGGVVRADLAGFRN